MPPGQEVECLIDRLKVQRGEWGRIRLWWGGRAACCLSQRRSLRLTNRLPVRRPTLLPLAPRRRRRRSGLSKQI